MPDNSTDNRYIHVSAVDSLKLAQAQTPQKTVMSQMKNHYLKQCTMNQPCPRRCHIPRVQQLSEAVRNKDCNGCWKILAVSIDFGSQTDGV